MQVNLHYKYISGWLVSYTRYLNSKLKLLSFHFSHILYISVSTCIIKAALALWSYTFFLSIIDKETKIIIQNMTYTTYKLPQKKKGARKIQWQYCCYFSKNRYLPKNYWMWQRNGTHEVLKLVFRSLDRGLHLQETNWKMLFTND